MTPISTPQPACGPYPHLAREAYFVGRYGPGLGYRLDAEWEEATTGLAPPRRRSRRWLRPGPVSCALRRLVLEGVVEAAVLVETRRCLDRLGACARRMVRARYAPSVGQGWEFYRRAQVGLDVLSELTPALLTPATVLRHWLGLGLVVGESLRAVRNWAVSGGVEEREEVDVKNALDGVRSAAQRLALEYPGEPVRNLAALARPEDFGEPVLLPEATCFHLLHLELARLDNELYCDLRGSSAPQPVLVLDTERLIFYGVERRLADLPQTPVALLWVLAERANRPVGRKQLREESGVQTTEDFLQIPLSRLRTELDKIRRESPGTTEVTAEHTRKLIRGLRSDDRDRPGPYKLDLDPSVVQICGARPHWMPRMGRSTPPPS